MRGQAADVGATRIAQNGYHYTKVATPNGKGKWRLTHHLIAEKMLGRPLAEDERVSFIGSRKDLSQNNLRITIKGKTSHARRIAALDARIAELTAERDRLQEEVDNG